jgi:hypothetical protein
MEMIKVLHGQENFMLCNHTPCIHFVILGRVPENDRVSKTCPVGNISTNARCIKMIGAPKFEVIWV